MPYELLLILNRLKAVEASCVSIGSNARPRRGADDPGSGSGPQCCEFSVSSCSTLVTMLAFGTYPGTGGTGGGRAEHTLPVVGKMTEGNCVIVFRVKQ